MVNAIITLAAVLLLVIFILIFRVQSLLAVSRGSDKRAGGALNKLSGSLFIIFLFVLVGSYLWYSFTGDYNLPEASSLHGVETDNLFLITIVIISIAFIVTHILLLGFAYKYQYSEDRKATFYPDNHKLELLWTVIPAIVLTLLVFQGYKTWDKIMTIPSAETDPGRVELEIVGQQFLWQVRYPGEDQKFGKHHFKLIDDVNQFGIDFNDKDSYDDFVPREIHLPKGRNVMFRIRAKDVLHSVFAPHFRLKMDAVPGMPTKFYFTPTKTTAEMRAELGNEEFNYEIACTEMCGKGHFGMRYIIVVEEPEAYDKWYKEQQAWSDFNKEYVEGKLTGESLVNFNNWLNKQEVVEPAVEIETIEQGATDDAAVLDQASLTTED